ncbi:MAG TPA: hypothetical protein VGD40_02215 [Chryseosolibacter sp.]
MKKLKDGSAGIFFQVLINRRKERIGLGISWPVERSLTRNELLQEDRNLRSTIRSWMCRCSMTARCPLLPHKTETYGTRIKDIPLSDMAKMLLADEIAFIKQQQSDKPYLKIQRMKDTSRIFQAYVDQVCNRISNALH